MYKKGNREKKLSITGYMPDQNANRYATLAMTSASSAMANSAMRFRLKSNKTSTPSLKSKSDTSSKAQKKAQKSKKKQKENGKVPRAFQNYEFVSKFVQQTKALADCFHESERKADSKTVGFSVPVLHTFLVKELQESSEINEPLYIVGTFVQRMFGIDLDQDIETSFEYRFNESPAGERVELRRRENHPFTITHDGKPVDIPMARFTLNVKVPLQREILFDCFPFTIIQATGTIELSSKIDGSSKSARLRPDLLVHNEMVFNNVALQVGKGISEHDLCEKMDKSTDYDFVSPYPKVSYMYDNVKEYCPKFKISFCMEELGMPKFIRFMLPMFLVAFVTTLNLTIDLVHLHAFDFKSLRQGVGSEVSIEQSDRYLNVAAAMALTAVFILPDIAKTQNTQAILTKNDIYVLFVFLALALASVPPTLFSPYFAIFGVAFLWLSFLIPTSNFYAYIQTKNKIRESRNKLMDYGYHPFVKGPNGKVWKPNMEDLSKLAYVEQYVETKKSKKGNKKFEMDNFWNIERVDESSDNHWEVSY